MIARTRKDRRRKDIIDFILRSVDEEPRGLGASVATRFGVSPTTAGRYLRSLEVDGLIVGTGKTSSRRYELRQLSHHANAVALSEGISEDVVWRNEIQPHLINLPPSIENICQYGFTEIFNNAIDHSESDVAVVEYEQTYAKVSIVINDAGVGIFEKIQKDFGLSDPRSALLELSKGKLTSDRSKHSGEGIFFASRMFNKFSIMSGQLYYQRLRTEDWGWLIESHDVAQYKKGTLVAMEINTNADWTTRETFEKFQNEEFYFAKTHVPVKLGQYGNEQLVSRSQAKRVLARFEKFQEVFLDFRGVDEIGQAFADEIFRVFAQDHPEVRIVVVDASTEIERMIAHVRSANPSSPATR